MSETTITADDTAPNLARQAAYLIEVASRAPSVHNTQPWRFKISEHALELHCDASRQLLEDQAGREMLISCGAALYGLRLGIRSLGYRPEVELFPGPVSQLPLARVRLGDAVPVTSDERKLLQAVPHRHTHRGPFESDPLPTGLLTRLQDDVTAEGATLAVIPPGAGYDKLAAILATWSRRRDLYPTSQAEIQSQAETARWTRDVGSQARDGVPAHAFPAAHGHQAGRWPQRDFDLGRGWGLLPQGGSPAPATAILVTAGDNEEDWIRAGQALQRLLLRAASQWAFASLQTEPLQAPATRSLIRYSLARPGWPQMLLQFGVARTTHPTARRPAPEVTRDAPSAHPGRRGLPSAMAGREEHG
jgi:nitroreductase